MWRVIDLTTCLGWRGFVFITVNREHCRLLIHSIGADEAPLTIIHLLWMNTPRSGKCR